MSYAAPKSQLLEGMPNLMVQDAIQASSNSLAIVNAGLAASGPFHVRIVLDSGATYYVGLPSLEAGGVWPIQMPAAKDGKPYSFTISVDCDNEVTESDETDNLTTVRFIG